MIGRSLSARSPRRSVLLVGREGLRSRRVRMALEATGYDVDEAHDGASASMRMLARDYRVVVLDAGLATEVRALVLSRIAASSHLDGVAVVLMGEPATIADAAWAHHRYPAHDRAALAAVSAVCPAYAI